MKGKITFKESQYKLGIEFLELSERSRNALKREGIQTIGDVIDHHSHIPNIRGLGKTSITEINNKLFEFWLADRVKEATT